MKIIRSLTLITVCFILLQGYSDAVYQPYFQLPSQSGQAGNCLGTDGTNAVWVACGSSVPLTLGTPGTDNPNAIVINGSTGGNIQTFIGSNSGGQLSGIIPEALGVMTNNYFSTKVLNIDHVGNTAVSGDVVFDAQGSNSAGFSITSGSGVPTTPPLGALGGMYFRQDAGIGTHIYQYLSGNWVSVI